MSLIYIDENTRKRASLLAEVMVKTPEQIVSSNDSRILYIERPDGSHAAFTLVRDFRELHPKIYETWQAHRALEKLKNTK